MRSLSNLRLVILVSTRLRWAMASGAMAQSTGTAVLEELVVTGATGLALIITIIGVPLLAMAVLAWRSSVRARRRAT